jgi:hypothetical protein
MKKQDTHSPSSLGELSETSWEDNPTIQWLMQHGRNLIIGILGICAAIFLIYLFTSRNTQKAENDYLTAENTFVKFMGAKPEEKEYLQQLEAIMQRRPELHAKYDGLIAQILIDKGQTNEALPFANSAIARTAEENRPFYTDYAQTTLLISANQYEEALKHATNLQKNLMGQLTSQTRDFGDTLLAFNLLRIAMLQQQLGLNQDELKTWQEWQKQINNSKKFAEQFDHFQLGKVTLTNYIETRVKQLEAVKK